MKITSRVIFSLIVIAIFSNQSNAQTFRKGAFLISISEGITNAQYKTNSNSIIANDISLKPQAEQDNYMTGIRDPLFIEYGITNRIGVGISLGGDIWKVNASQFYGINAPNKDVNILTEEATFDVVYHTLISRRVDWSVYTSVGPFAVGFNENFNGEEQNYYAEGHIVRFGSSIRYYFFKRWAIMGMVSHYNSKSTPKNPELNSLKNNYSTNIKGWAFEWGFSFRIGKYDWKKEDYARK